MPNPNRPKKYKTKPKPQLSHEEIKERNKFAKQISEQNAIAEECFIIGAAIKAGVRMQLKRKQKISKEIKNLQRFSIERVYSDQLEREIDSRYNKWLKKEINGETEKNCQREKDKCRQNIILNVLVEYLQQHDEYFEFKISRRAERVVKRERLVSFNDYNEDSIHDVGVQLSEYFIVQIPADPKKNRRETSVVITSIPDEIKIPLCGTYEDTNIHFTNTNSVVSQLSEFEEMNDDNQMEEIEEMIDNDNMSTTSQYSQYPQFQLFNQMDTMSQMPQITDMSQMEQFEQVSQFSQVSSLEQNQQTSQLNQMAPVTFNQININAFIQPMNMDITVNNENNNNFVQNNFDTNEIQNNYYQAITLEQYQQLLMLYQMNMMNYINIEEVNNFNDHNGMNENNEMNDNVEHSDIQFPRISDIKIEEVCENEDKEENIEKENIHEIKENIKSSENESEKNEKENDDNEEMNDTLMNNVINF